jgi:hypothetical protein
MAAWSFASALGRAGIRLAAPALLALGCASCASIGSPAVWADGEVRDFETFRPIPGASVILEDPGIPSDLSNTDETNLAGRFSVFQSVSGAQRKIPILVVADGFKPAEFSLPVLQSNTLLVRLASASSSHQSRIEYMAVLPGDGSSADGACGSE